MSMDFFGSAATLASAFDGREDTAALLLVVLRRVLVAGDALVLRIDCTSFSPVASGFSGLSVVFMGDYLIDQLLHFIHGR